MLMPNLPITLRLRSIDELKKMYIHKMDAYYQNQHYEGLFFPNFSHFISNEMLEKDFWGTYVNVIKISKWTRDSKVFHIDCCGDKWGFPIEWFCFDFIESDEFEV